MIINGNCIISTASQWFSERVSTIWPINWIQYNSKVRLAASPQVLNVIFNYSLTEEQPTIQSDLSPNNQLIQTERYVRYLYCTYITYTYTTRYVVTGIQAE